METKTISRQPVTSDAASLILLAVVTLVIHFLTNGGYGFFRDEFYYMACGEHLDWGYVDHPPFVALMAALTRAVLGDSLQAIRFLPALCAALTVLLAGLMARELGGGRFAQALAGLAVLIGPVYLIVDHIFSMNCFDYVFWALAIYIVIKILKEDRPKLWVLFGLVAGIGLMTKYSMGFLGLGLVAGLVVTSSRKHLLSRWLWLGGLLAFVIFLPHIIWEIRQGFPTREFIRNATLYKNLPMSPVRFLAEEALEVHPFTLPIWLAGLYFYLGHADGKRYRAIGWIYVSVLLLFLITKAKPYYLAPAYFMLLAAGAVVIERFIERRNAVWLKATSLAALVVGGLITLPLALPVLPVDTFIRYQAFLHIPVEVGEKHRMGKLPQMYADMFGWEEMVAAVAKVYNSLPPEERAKCAIYASNYGEAGAIDFFGKKYGLPKAISGHNSYWLWGPRDYTGEIVITVGEEKQDVEKTFGKVELAATVVDDYAMPYENNLPIFICRKPKMSLQQVWPRTKHYI